MFSISNQDLYRSLKELNQIEEKVLDGALKESEKEGTNLYEVLIGQDLIPDSVLGRIMAELAKVKFVSLEGQASDPNVTHAISEEFSNLHKAVVYGREGEIYKVAMADPGDLAVRQKIANKLGTHQVALATARELDKAQSYYSSDLNLEVQNLLLASKNDPNNVKVPTIKVVDTMLTEAALQGASDIHFEPQENLVLVRFRVDGVLKDVVTLPKDIDELLVTRVKVMSNLRIDEHLAAQDGKFQFKTEEDELDVRVSIVPVVDGEKVVMRLLSEKTRSFSLRDLGIGETELANIKEAYSRPYGMVLATGPTGCGKTTTMYAIIKLLNKRQVNISTIEDPVEYEIEGINQIQVNAKTNLTFASGLRSIVRQDPDIILVGEIRDDETAGIAINSALTGHLLLSTLHTNDAATAIPRLIDLGIEPYLVASTVNVIIAQRLVRKICSNCRVSQMITNADLVKKVGKEYADRVLLKGKSIRAYEGKGCSICGGTGYIGRIGIYEVMQMSDKLREAITSREDASVIKKIAISEGMRTMAEDGMAKVDEGITSLDEVLKVTAS